MSFDAALVFEAGHPAFAGHFPGQPIVPGVLLLDAALHALATGSGRVAVEVASAKFLRPVGPDEVLALSCQPGEAGRGSFEISTAAPQPDEGDRASGAPNHRHRIAVGQVVMGPAV